MFSRTLGTKSVFPYSQMCLKTLLKMNFVGFADLHLQIVSSTKSLNKMALSMLQEQAALWHIPFDIHPAFLNLIHLDCDISLNLAGSYKLCLSACSLCTSWTWIYVSSHVDLQLLQRSCRLCVPGRCKSHVVLSS